MGGRLASFGATAAAGIGAAAGAIGVSAFKAAADAETIQVAFKTLTGSSDKAKAHMADLQKFAANSPFDFKGLASASVKLQGVGVAAKDVIPHLTAWGNAASAMGVSGESFENVLGALSQALGNGRLGLEDFNQMADNGLPVIGLLAEAMGVSQGKVRELATAGKLATDKVMPLLEGIMNKKFGTAMADQSKTANGQLSSLADSWDQLLVKIGTPLLPIGKAAIGGLSTLVSNLGKYMAPVAGIFDKLKPAMKGAFSGTGSLFKPILSEVKKLKPSFDKAFSSVGPVLVQVGQVLQTSVIPFFRDLIKAALPVWSTIVQVVTGTVIPALMGLVQTVLPHFQTFVNFLRTQIVPVLMGMWQQAQPVIQQFGNVLKTVFQGIGVAINVLAPILQFLWKFLGPIVISTLQGLWSGILGVIKGALNMIQGVVNIFIGIFTGNWSKVWTGVKQIFTGIWQFIVGAFKIYIYGSVVSILRGGVAKIATMWRSGWTGIKTVFTTIWNFIKGLFSGNLGRLGSLASSGIARVKTFFSNGFRAIYDAVKSKMSSVVNVVKEIPGKIKSVLSSLPGKLKEIGKNIIQGLVNGIKGSLGAVMGAAKAIIDKIPGPIKKALGIHSPSRVMAQIGKWITEGLVKGMLGGSKKVASTSKKLHELVTKAFKAGKISKKKKDALNEYISKQNKKLMKLSKERESIHKRLTNLQAKLTDMKKAKADMSSSIAGKAKDYGSFMGAFDSSEYGDNSASAIIGRLKAKLKHIVDFRKNLGLLAKRGLGKGIIAEIAQAGPEEGGKMAEALLNASGSQISELNSVNSAIGKQSDNLGKFVSGNYYDAGIHMVNGLVNGLKSKEKHLTNAIENMSKQMVKALKKALGIKSPSRVFMGLGGFTAAGFTNGIRNGQGDVQKAIDEMAGTRPTGRLANRSIAREAVLQGAYAAQGAPVVHVTVQGNVTAERALAKSIATTIRDEIVRNGKRNGGRTGL
jgi:tape measure domain-containing protein